MCINININGGEFCALTLISMEERDGVCLQLTNLGSFLSVTKIALTQEILSKMRKIDKKSLTKEQPKRTHRLPTKSYKMLEYLLNGRYGSGCGGGGESGYGGD